MQGKLFKYTECSMTIFFPAATGKQYIMSRYNFNYARNKLIFKTKITDGED